MKVVLALLAVAGTFAAVHHFPCLTRHAETLAAWVGPDDAGSCCAERTSCDESAAGTLLTSAECVPAVAGRWVEARTASVFAGACHFNSEYTTQGRRAVVAGLFETGQVDGVDLEGLSFVAVVAADENLAEGGARRSRLYLSDELSSRRREALERAVREVHVAALGDVVEVVPADVQVRFEGDAYAARVGNLVVVEGSAMADRACCKMPLNVWYDALTELDVPIVGMSTRLEVVDIGLGPAFERFDENNAFVGAFRLPLGSELAEEGESPNGAPGAPRAQGAQG